MTMGVRTPPLKMHMPVTISQVPTAITLTAARALPRQRRIQTTAISSTAIAGPMVRPTWSGATSRTTARKAAAPAIRTATA